MSRFFFEVSEKAPQDVIPDSCESSHPVFSRHFPTPALGGVKEKSVFQSSLFETSRERTEGG